MNKLIAILTLCASIATPTVSAKEEKKDKPDEDRVVVTMKDGSVENGKVTKYWTALLKKGFNKTFTVKTDDARELHLNPENVDSLYFPLRGEKQFKVYGSCVIANPKIGKKNNLDKIIVARGAQSEHARIVAYHGWTDVHYGNRIRREMVQTNCIKFANDSVAYPFFYYKNGGFNIAVMKHHLKSKNPELAAYMESYFKQNKKAKKEIGDNPRIILEAYEEFIKQGDTAK